MKKLAKLFIAGLAAFGLSFSVGLSVKENKQVQEVQATGESENPVATVDQVIVVGANPNVTAGLTYADGVLTVDQDFPLSFTELTVRVNTGGTKADLTIVINRIKPFDVVSLYNQYGNLTVNCYATLNICQIYVLGNLTIGGTGIVLLSRPQPFPIPSRSMIYVEGKLVIEGKVDISGGLPVEYANSLISTKYLEVNTNNGININCNSSKPEFGAAGSRYATICFHDCPNVDALASRLTLKHGKFILKKYYSEEDAQYNDKFGFVAWDANNGLNPFWTDHFDLENKLFTGYQIECTNSELKVKTRNIDFDENGGTGDSVRYGWYPIGSTITLPECPYTAPEGQHFVGWALGSETATPLKQPGETFVLEEGDNPSSWKYDYYSVYAIWEEDAEVLTGTVSITGSLKYDETLTASVTDTNNSGTLSYQWRRNGDDIASATSSTYKVSENDIGYTLSVKVSSSIETGFIVGTASGVIAKADGPDAPTGISAVACTTEANNDGVLKGVTTDMEYKLSSLSGWVDGTGADITGLVSGTYNVRYKETSTHEAGQSANIVINAYNAPTQYAVTVNKGTANPVTAVAGTTITITADAPEDGYEFDKWVSSSGVVFADASSATTTFVMIEGNVAVTATYKPVVVPPAPSSSGLSGGAIAGIVIASILVAGIGGFALVWFVIKKKTWADFVAIFKKK